MNVMDNQKSFSKFKRLQELLVLTSLRDVPAIALGNKLRNFGYKTIFGRIGNSVYIQEGVEFLNASNMEVADGVHIFKGARLDARGHQNNKIIFESQVAIERNVDIGALVHTSVRVKEKTFIGPGVCIAGPGDIVIGKSCLIAAHVGIFANNHNFSDPNRNITEQGVTSKGITIEDDCWLGHAVTVLDGVTIGQGSVIGAGAVVTKDIPAYSVAVGTPARVIKSRKSKELWTLEQEKLSHTFLSKEENQHHKSSQV